MSNQKQGSKELYPELLRVFACLAVILIHTQNRGASRVLVFDRGTADYWLSLLFTVYIRFAIPVFLAISGAFLLGRKDEPVRKQVIRIARTAAVLLIFSLFYYVIGVISSGEKIRPLDFLKQVYSTNINFVLWYLYTYLAFLVSLPLLRPLAQNLSNRGFLYMFGLYLLMGSLLPCLEVLLLNNQVHYHPRLSLAWLSQNLVIYPMFGYYFHNRLDPERDIKDWWWIWPACAVSMLMTAFTLDRLGVLSGEGLTMRILRTYVEKFDLLHAASVFLLARCLCTRLRIPDGAAKFITSVGSCVFGIYLIHVLFMGEESLFPKLWNFLRTYMGGLTSTVLASICVMMISYVIVWVLKKLPGIRKLL